VLADRERSGRRDEQRVGVGRRLEHRLGAEVRGCAGPVLDDHRMAPFGGELLAEEARDGVEHVAGRHRHDELDGVTRIVDLRERGCRRDRYEQRNEGTQETRTAVRHDRTLTMALFSTIAMFAELRPHPPMILLTTLAV